MKAVLQRKRERKQNMCGVVCFWCDQKRSNKMKMKKENVSSSVYAYVNEMISEELLICFNLIFFWFYHRMRIRKIDSCSSSSSSLLFIRITHMFGQIFEHSKCTNTFSTWEKQRFFFSSNAILSSLLFTEQFRQSFITIDELFILRILENDKKKI